MVKHGENIFNPLKYNTLITSFFLFSPNYNPYTLPFLLAKLTTLHYKDRYVLINFTPLTTRPQFF